MSHYSVQAEELSSSDELLRFHTKTDRYWNLIRKDSFSYYYNQKMMLNGILIDNDDDFKSTTRTVYDLSNLSAEVGGFSQTVSFIFVLIFPLLRFGSLEDYLVSRLYKQSPSQAIYPPHGDLNAQRKLLVMSQSSVQMRKPIAERIRNPIVEFFKRNGLCFSTFLYDRQDYNYLKSQQKLASELDIKRIVKTLRYLRSSVRYLTNSTERRLLRL